MLFVATVLTVYGIETVVRFLVSLFAFLVATVLTVYGIETQNENGSFKVDAKLQQCLPFTVLKPEILYRLHSVLMSCNSAYRLRY